MEDESSAIESAKRQRLSPTRVCVVCYCRSAGSEKDDEFNFYIVDCDSSLDEFTHRKPNFRFKSEGSSPPVAFCALESKLVRPSTLYMFEGYDHLSPGKGGRCARKFVMPDDIIYDYNLQKKDLVDIKPMGANKFSVKALPTPDGKSILVFSSEIAWTDNGFFGDSFELYDVDNDSWELLPGFPSKRRPSTYILRIKAYGFESDSRFRIQMENEIFVLDLKASIKAWELLCVCKIPRADGHFLGIGGFYFTPDLAYDSQNHGRIHLSLSPFPRDDAYGKEVPMHELYRGRVGPCPYITSLGRKDGVYDIGVLRARCYPHHMTTTKNVRAIVDIYRTDIGKYRRDEEEYKKIDKVGEEPALDTIGPLSKTAKKTIKFMIDFDFNTYFSGQMCLYAV